MKASVFFKSSLIAIAVLAGAGGYYTFTTSLSAYNPGERPSVDKVVLNNYDKTDLFYKMMKNKAFEVSKEDNYDSILTQYKKTLGKVIPEKDMLAVFQECKAQEKCQGPSTTKLREVAVKNGNVKQFDTTVMNALSNYQASKLNAGPTAKYKFDVLDGTPTYINTNIIKSQQIWEEQLRESKERSLENSQWFFLISAFSLLLFTILTYKKSAK